MSTTAAMMPTVSVSNYSPVKVAAKKNFNLKEFLSTPKTKDKLNYLVNGGASLASTLTFLNGNLKLSEPLQKLLEPLSEYWLRAGTMVSGLLGAVDTWQKKNALSFIGYSLMMPIGFLLTGYDQWLARGVSSGLTNFVLITDRREVTDSNGEPVKDKDGNIQYLSGDFSDKGFAENIKSVFVESFKMIKEVINKPSRIFKFSHGTFITSTFQIIGPLIGLAGFKQIGAMVRNISGIGSFLSMTLDKKNQPKDSPKFSLNLKSPIVQCNLLRIGTSILDVLKRFDYFSNNINNLTEMSLALDRTASILFSSGVFKIKKS